MNSGAFAILNAVVATLQADPTLCDGGVHRNRVRPMSQSVRTSVSVYGQGEVNQTPVGQGALRVQDTSIRCDCYAKPVGDRPEDEVCDELSKRVHDLLMANPGLNGLAGLIHFDQRKPAELEIDNEGTCCLSLSFVIRHAAPAATL